MAGPLTKRGGISVSIGANSPVLFRGRRLQGLQTERALVLDLQLEAAGAADAVDRRRAEHKDVRVGKLQELDAQRLGQHLRIEVEVPRALLEAVEDDEQAAQVGHVIA